MRPEYLVMFQAGQGAAKLERLGWQALDNKARVSGEEKTISGRVEGHHAGTRHSENVEQHSGHKCCLELQSSKRAIEGKTCMDLLTTCGLQKQQRIVRRDMLCTCHKLQQSRDINTSHTYSKCLDGVLHASSR